MRKLTFFLAISVLVLGVSGCSQAVAQDNTKTIITGINEVNMPSMNFVEQIALDANYSQNQVTWKVVTPQTIDVMECRQGELIKVGETRINPDNTYTVFRYDGTKQLKEVFTTSYIASIPFRPQNR